MLVLTRKCQESVIVGGSDGFEHVLKVTVLDIGNGRVKLGFDVDPVAPFRRAEIRTDLAPSIWQQSIGVLPVVASVRRG